MIGTQTKPTLVGFRGMLEDESDFEEPLPRNESQRTSVTDSLINESNSSILNSEFMSLGDTLHRPSIATTEYTIAKDGTKRKLGTKERKKRPDFKFEKEEVLPIDNKLYNEYTGYNNNNSNFPLQTAQKITVNSNNIHNLTTPSMNENLSNDSYLQSNKDSSSVSQRINSGSSNSGSRMHGTNSASGIGRALRDSPYGNNSSMDSGGDNNTIDWSKLKTHTLTFRMKSLNPNNKQIRLKLYLPHTKDDEDPQHLIMFINSGAIMKNVIESLEAQYPHNYLKGRVKQFCIADDDGDIDEDFPPLELNQDISNMGIGNFYVDVTFDNETPDFTREESEPVSPDKANSVSSSLSDVLNKNKNKNNLYKQNKRRNSKEYKYSNSSNSNNNNSNSNTIRSDNKNPSSYQSLNQLFASEKKRKNNSLNNETNSNLYKNDKTKKYNSTNNKSNNRRGTRSIFGECFSCNCFNLSFLKRKPKDNERSLLADYNENIDLHSANNNSSTELYKQNSNTQSNYSNIIDDEMDEPELSYSQPEYNKNNRNNNNNKNNNLSRQSYSNSNSNNKMRLTNENIKNNVLSRNSYSISNEWN